MREKLKIIIEKCVAIGKKVWSWLRKDWRVLLSVFRAFIATLLRKGKQRQRMMLVPHAGKKIITLNIPNYSIFLFVAIVIFLIIFSIISLNVRETSHSTIYKLSNISEVQQFQLALFRKQSRFAKNSFLQLWEQMNNLSYGVGSGAYSHFPFAANDRALSESLEKYVGTNKMSKLKEIQHLQLLNMNLHKSTEQLSSVVMFLSNLKHVVRYTPSGWPVSGGGFVTSQFGRRRSPFTGAWQHHTGIDISWWPGSPIIATAAGTVVDARWMGGYGLCVLIKHKYGFVTRYGHMQSLRVSAGERVKKRQVLGAMGSTGLSTGYHVHYEVIYYNKHLDPDIYLINRF